MSPTASCLLLASLLLCPQRIFAQREDDEPAAVVELGGGAARDLNKDGRSTFGPTVAVEFTPIENWLEIEMGVTPLFARHSTEWGADLLFKKPWTLSRKAERMFGLGPEWIHASDHGTRTNSAAGEAALDFMYWPAAKRRFGWYLEPAYEYNFARGHERSIGITGGLLIAIP